MSKSSSGDEMHPYVKDEIEASGTINWTTAKITRGPSEYVTFKDKRGKYQTARIDGKILNIEIVTSRKNQQNVIYQKP